MANPIPANFGRGGVPVRHRRGGGGHAAPASLGTAAPTASVLLPLYHGQTTRRRRRRRRGGIGGSGGVPLLVVRGVAVLAGAALLTSVLRGGGGGGGGGGGDGKLVGDGRGGGGGAGDLADFDDWKRLRGERKRRRRREREQNQQRQQQQEQRQRQRQRGLGTLMRSLLGGEAAMPSDAAADESHSHSRQGHEEEEEEAEEWDLPYVHIVNTRFMQSQGTLTSLAWARLHLFKAFCLSTMVHQTSQNFLWIIKTDPNLDYEIREAMVDLLKPYPNYYLIGSERNYLIGHEEGAWRGGTEGEDALQSPIYSGDVALLRRAHAAREGRIVLETRLDADDGLVTGYLEHVERVAVERFGDGVGEGGGGDEDRIRPKWLYWCSKQVVEWFADPTSDVGACNAVQHTKLCVTPGITIGFPVGTPYEDVPQHEHDRIIKDIERDGGCGLANNTDCLDMVKEFPMMAVRSRTPTSAGMMGITMDEKDALPEDKRALLWKLLQSKYFRVSADDVRETNKFIHDNLIDIARDNLKGQCTHGHSCKLSSKDQLQRLTELAQMKGKGVSIDEPKLGIQDEGEVKDVQDVEEQQL